MKNQKQKYLVTGGTGFLGRSLVKKLVSSGHQVRVFDDDSRGSFQTLKDIQEQIEFVKGDVRNPQSVREACVGMDSVCHLAFVNGTQYFYEKPELVLDVGVKGMVNVLDGCIAEGVRELFLMSSSEVYQLPSQIPTDETVPMIIPDPQNPRFSYAGGKLISELMAINYGRKHFDRVLIVRPHNVYGPQMGWEHVVPQFVVRLKELASQSSGKITFPIQGSGQETRSFVYIDDFTDGVMKVLERGEHLGIYHIGTMEEVEIREVAKKIAAYMGREIEIQTTPIQQGSTPRRCPDIKKAMKLGYEPQVTLSKGIELTTQWYLENAASRLERI